MQSAPGASLRQKSFLPPPPSVGPDTSVGVLELGGASMQITFMPHDEDGGADGSMPVNYSRTLPLASMCARERDRQTDSRGQMDRQTDKQTETKVDRGWERDMRVIGGI